MFFCPGQNLICSSVLIPCRFERTEGRGKGRGGGGVLFGGGGGRGSMTCNVPTNALKISLPQSKYG